MSRYGRARHEETLMAREGWTTGTGTTAMCVDTTTGGETNRGSANDPSRAARQITGLCGPRSSPPTSTSRSAGAPTRKDGAAGPRTAPAAALTFAEQAVRKAVLVAAGEWPV